MKYVTDRRRFLTLAAASATYGKAWAQAMPKVNIGVASASLPGGVVRIVKEMGLFEKNGLDVNVSVLDSGSVGMAAMVAGSLQFMTSAGTEIIFPQSRGQKVVALLPVYGSFAAVLVLATDVARKLGVSPAASVKERLKALDGLLIACPAATSSYTLALRPAAESAGAKPRITYMTMQTMVSALESGAVQGFIASSPYYAVAPLRGSGVIWINGPRSEFPEQFTPASASIISAMRDYVGANPDVVRRVAAALREFSNAVTARPNDVNRAISKLFPDIDAKTLDFIFQTEAAGFQTRAVTVADMAREIAFLKAGGTNVPNIDQIQPADLMMPLPTPR